MRTFRRIAAVAAAATMASLCLAPALPAVAASSAVVLQVDDSTGRDHEYQKYCSGSPTFQCNITRPGYMYFRIRLAPGSAQPAGDIVVGYEIVDVTTTAGQDYQARTSGTVIVRPGYVSEAIFVNLVDDRVAEPTETFRLRMTSSSAPADISDTGIGTILDGSQIPADCSLAWVENDRAKSLTCSSRPATGQWQLTMYCMSFGIEDVAYGTRITGNGTSTARCDVGLAMNTFFNPI